MTTMRFLLVLALHAGLAAPASAQWTNSVSTDEMTGKRQAFAHSPTTAPTRPMSVQVSTMGFTQKWGDSFINFDDAEVTIARILTAGTVLLELDWYGADRAYFRFSLRGSAAAVAKARASCQNP